MFCEKCGKEYMQGATFCTSCGNVLSNESEQQPSAVVETIETKGKNIWWILTYSMIVFINALPVNWLINVVGYEVYSMVIAVIGVLRIVPLTFGIIALVTGLKQKNEMTKWLSVLVFIMSLGNFISWISNLEYLFY